MPRVLLFILCFLYPTLVHSIPAFHTVNSVDAYGNKCPAVTKYGLACPILCVPDLKICPNSLQPTCPSGKTYCLDGSCKESCKDVKNVCLCSRTVETAPRILFPCMPGQFTNVSNYDPGIKSKQTYEWCAKDVLVGGFDNFTLWTDVIEGNEKSKNIFVWNVCDSSAVVYFTYREPMWITIFSVFGAYAVLLIIWSVTKSYLETVSKPKTEVIVDDAIFKGFRNDISGTILYFFTFTISLGWFAFLIVITADYYGSAVGTSFGVFYGSYPLSATTFTVWWVSATAWFIGLSILRSHVRNFFRVRTSLSAADFVQVERERVVVKLLTEDYRKKLDGDLSSEEKFTSKYADGGGFKLNRIKGFWSVVEDELMVLFGFKNLISTVPVLKMVEGEISIRYIEYQSSRYVFDTESGIFAQYKYNLGQTHGELLKNTAGLTEEEAKKRLRLIGANFIEVQVPNFAVALGLELSTFFYIYQGMIMWLFYYLSYWQVGVVDTGIILLSAMIKVVIKQNSEHRVKRLAELTTSVGVRRGLQFVETSSHNLVPGDVVKVESGNVFSFDGVLLSGDVIVDESSLTGEALPVRKVPVKDEATVYDAHSSGKIHSLFAGTTILQSQGVGSMPAFALVIATGTSTDKGNLIHKILFQPPVSFIFHEQLKLVFFLLLIWACVLLGFGVSWLKGAGTTAFFYGAFCLSQVMSPLLPAVLVVGQATGASALQKKSIFSIDLARVIMAGKVRIFCFDKTGTLTREGMQLHGGLAVTKENNESKFTSEIHPFSSLPHLLQLSMKTCHAVGNLQGQLVGNPVDQEMFKSTSCQVSETPEEGYVDTIKTTNAAPTHIIKRFEFQHAKASMSVIVHDTATKSMHVFVKGSFEKINEFCYGRNIPGNFKKVTEDLTKQGYYVLGVAHKQIMFEEARFEETKTSLKLWGREDAQKNVEFIGLLCFRNQVKDDTGEAILRLKEGNTRVVMITGDNALTGVHVARKINMIDSETQVLLGDVDSNSNLVWIDVDSDESVSDIDEALAKAKREGRKLELAVTEKACDILSTNDDDLLRKYLLSIRVFGRATPHGKVRVVQLHMERATTAMCGDGGNDSGALRAAHVGLAMSEAEASVVSPFSTNKRTVHSAVELLLEGRAALATSFATYKYLIMYGEIMAMLKLFTFYFSTSLSQNTWIFVDAFITVSLSFAMTLSKTANKLSPERPTAKILGPETLISVLGQIFINYMFLIGSYVYLFQQDWFRCHEFDARSIDAAKWWLLGDNFEAQTLGFLVLFQFINSAAVFNWGFRYRESWHRNYTLVALWAIFLAILSYILLADPNVLGCWFRFNCGDPSVLKQLGYAVPDLPIEPYNVDSGNNVYPKWFRYHIWIICLANMAAGLLFERFIVLGSIREKLSKKRAASGKRIPI